jgi:hypothetical protein
MSDFNITPQEIYHIGLKDAKECDQLLKAHGKPARFESEWIAKWGKYAQ